MSPSDYDSNNLYPQAGINAQPEVQEAIDRFRSLSDGERRYPPLLYWLIGSSTPAYKMSKTDARYADPSPSTKNCGNCRHAWTSAKGGFHICDLMRGRVGLRAVCAMWEA